ncbi:hypothetical protein ACIXMS_05445 [Bacteroides fragilis]
MSSYSQSRPDHLFNDIPSALTKGGIPDCFIIAFRGEQYVRELSGLRDKFVTAPMGNRKKLDVNSNNYATSLTAFRDYLNNLGNKTLVYNREEALAIVIDLFKNSIDTDVPAKLENENQNQIRRAIEKWQNILFKW